MIASYHKKRRKTTAIALGIRYGEKNGKNFSKNTCILEKGMVIYKSCLRDQYAAVAQLDRVFDYESKGRGFESLRARQGTGRKYTVFAACILL